MYIRAYLIGFVNIKKYPPTIESVAARSENSLHITRCGDTPVDILHTDGKTFAQALDRLYLTMGSPLFEWTVPLLGDDDRRRFNAVHNAWSRTH